VKIVVPTTVWLARKRSKSKRFALNLNVYRNAHYQILNNAKRQFYEDVYPMLRRLPKLSPPIKLQYAIYFAQRRGDVANVGSVVDKFFCDALVKSGHIPDDNYRMVSEISFKYGGIAPKNPRCEVVIFENC